MDLSDEFRLRRGQAIALQHVVFLPQNAQADEAGLAKLLNNATTLTGEQTRNVTMLGLCWSINFLVVLTVEFAPKALLVKEIEDHYKTHGLSYLYSKLPSLVRNRLQAEYSNLDPVQEDLVALLTEHGNDSERWTYLEGSIERRSEAMDMQLAACAILHEVEGSSK